MMPSHSHDHTASSNFKLSRSQELILDALDGQHGLSLRKLILTMAQRPISTSEEIEYARKAKAHCDWLEAHNLVVAIKSNGHLIYTKNMVLRPVENGSQYRPSYSGTRRLILVSAVALVLSACSQNPFANSPAAEKQIRAYNSSTLPVITERIAQYTDPNGESVYRYCRENECPGPTPKVMYRVSEKTSQQLGTPPTRPRINDEKSLKEALKSFAKDAGKTDPSTELAPPATAKVIQTEMSASHKKSSVKPVPRTESPVSQESGAPSNAMSANQSGKSSALNAASPSKTAQATENKSADEAPRSDASGRPLNQNNSRSASETAPKADRVTSSRSGMISFSNGAEWLSTQSRDQIANLADQAREADTIKLRGHAASRSLTEEQKRLALGRSIAVKMEFMKLGIERQKIRILNPRENDLVDESNVNSETNRSVEIVFLKGKQPVA